MWEEIIKVPRLCLTSDVKEVFVWRELQRQKSQVERKRDWKTLFIVQRRIPESPIASQNGLAFIFMVGDASHLGGVGRK